jgi:hypothetical protein
MNTLKNTDLEIRWSVSPSRESVEIVFISGMEVDKVLYKTDALTGEIIEMSMVKSKPFIKACHAVLRRSGLMEKKTVVYGGLFKKERNRRFFTQAFLHGEDRN